MSEVEELSKAAGEFADYQLDLALQGGPTFGTRAALVAAFLKGWAYAKRSAAQNKGGE